MIDFVLLTSELGDELGEHVHVGDVNVVGPSRRSAFLHAFTNAGAHDVLGFVLFVVLVVARLVGRLGFFRIALAIGRSNGGALLRVGLGVASCGGPASVGCLVLGSMQLIAI